MMPPRALLEDFVEELASFIKQDLNGLDTAEEHKQNATSILEQICACLVPQFTECFTLGNNDAYELPEIPDPAAFNNAINSRIARHPAFKVVDERVGIDPRNMTADEYDEFIARRPRIQEEEASEERHEEFLESLEERMQKDLKRMQERMVAS